MIAAATFGATSTNAITLRYAVVVGSNEGADGDAGRLPPLRHAEREAAAMRDGLISFAGFSGTADRMVLLIRPTRDELHRAIRGVAERIIADQQTFPDAKILFAFF